jgi:uncharacterized membrane-anchored protein
MIIPSRKWLLAGVAVAAVQTAAIGWMVWGRIQLLKTGREIVLPVVPVDPRSLFRGDYVILSYEAQRVPTGLLSDELYAQRPGSFYVTLAKTGDTWAPVAASMKPGQPAADQITLLARTRNGYWPPRPTDPASKTGPTIFVRYGIESYFVPEGKGRALEKLAGEKKLAAVVAVDAKGNAAIKGLMIDGKLQYEEPLL